MEQLTKREWRIVYLKLIGLGLILNLILSLLDYLGIR